MIKENLDYKNHDHQFRGQDEYANAKYDITVDWLRLKPGLLVANVGCGSGEFNLRLAQAGARVLACEPEASAFRAAVDLARGLDDVKVTQQGLHEFVVASPQVDALVMHDVLEHLEDEAGAVEDVARLLKPGGEAVISVPAFNFLFGYHDVQLGHYRRYSKQRLIEVLKPSFEILRARYYGSLFIPVTLVFSKWMKRGYPVQSATGKPWKRSAFRMACQIQRSLPEPVGTSVLVHVRRK